MEKREDACQRPSIAMPELRPGNAEWLEGLQDGQQARGESSPDLRRGRNYADGWFVGRLQGEPASLARH